MNNDLDIIEHISHCVFVETGTWVPLVDVRDALAKDRADGHADPTAAEALMIVKPNPSLDLKAAHPAIWDLLLGAV